jgi:hypothetical protein
MARLPIQPEGGIRINEVYRDYTPPVNATAIVRKLLRTVPDKYLKGLVLAGEHRIVPSITATSLVQRFVKATVDAGVRRMVNVMPKFVKK